MSKYNEEKALEKGKKWMRNSKNITHDFSHAENVAKHSLQVYKSLKEDGWVGDLDAKLILITAFWHDCYKATYKRSNVFSEIFEGVYSAKIVERELERLVSPERLKIILRAIKMHNNFIYFLLVGKRMPFLTRVLIEADAIEGSNVQRKKKNAKQEKTIFYIIIQSLTQKVFYIIQKRYVKSSYAKSKINYFRKEMYAKKA